MPRTTDRNHDRTTDPTPKRTTNRTVGVAIALVVVLALGGTYLLGHRAGGNAQTPSASAVSLTSVAERASATDHNQDDEMFAMMMVEHHTQAITMSKLAADRAGSKAVEDLAAVIEGAQGPEIERMAGWLDAWGTSGDMSGMDHGSGSSSMDGMMSDSDMASLAKLKGAAFDQEFLTMMIAHHAGAVTMSRQELRQGTNADALALAASIVVSQQGQIAQMRSMLS